MGNTKLKWTSEEEAALKGGVDKHGIGRWRMILNDPEFAPSLVNRSNIDLKDKWRNLGISSSGRRPKNKTLALRVTPIQSIAPNTPKPYAPDSLVVTDVDAVDAVDVYAFAPLTNNRDNSFILEAITSMKDPNGSDVDATLHYIKQKHQVPENFRRLLISRLRSLVLQGKLEENENRFKIKDDGQGPSQTHSLVSLSEESSAASRVAEADNKSFVLAEAVKEFERITALMEDAESALEVVKYIYDKCLRGETVLV